MVNENVKQLTEQSVFGLPIRYVSFEELMRPKAHKILTEGNRDERCYINGHFWETDYWNDNKEGWRKWCHICGCEAIELKEAA